MLSWGTQRTLARVSCASATQTLAWAAATISGRASESRKAVARLIGKPTSVDSKGARLSLATRSLVAGVTAGSAGAERTDSGLCCPNGRGGGIVARGAVGAFDSLGGRKVAAKSSD